MIHRQIIVARLIAMLLIGGASHTMAAEIRLRSECRPQGTLVLLGEAAEIFAARDDEAAELAAIELMPAPSAGDKRFVRVREIQDQLEQRGLNLAQHRLSGASQLTLFGPDGNAKGPRPMSSTTAKRAERTTQDAIIKFLSEKVSPTDPWDVSVQLSEDQARLISAAQKVTAEGKGPPWTGRTSFTISADTPTGATRISIEAQVSLPPAVVVSTRTIAKGAVIRAGDVQLDRSRAPAAGREGFERLEDVLGQETTRTIAQGQSVDVQAVRQPLMIRRNDVVTVHVRRPGIQVRVTARARDDGSLGELVNVESMLDRTVYLARVCGTQEVEVLAVPVSIGTSAERPTVAAKPAMAEKPAARHVARQAAAVKKQ